MNQDLKALVSRSAPMTGTPDSLRVVILCVLAVFASTVCRGQKDAAPPLTRPELIVQTGHSDQVFSVAFSADGQTLASCGYDKTIKLWDVVTGRELRTLQGHSLPIRSVAFSAAGQTLASGSDDNTIKLWEVATGRELRTLQGHSDSVLSVAFSGDGKTLASGGLDKTIKLWEVANGRELRTLQGHSESVRSVAFSVDGKTLASGSADKTIKLWEVATGRELRTLQGHSELVCSVGFDADGQTLATGSGDRSIKLWEVATGRQLRTLQGHSGSVFSVGFSTDGKTLASGSDDETIKLWEVATGRELRTLRGHSYSVFSVTFSPDGKTLASGSGDRTIGLWEASSGQELRTLWGHSESIYSAAFSPIGRTLASGGYELIKLWEGASGRELRTLRGHSNLVLSVAFSADGKTLASSGYDKTIKLWDVVNGRELRTLQGHSESVRSVTFSADGQTLASGSEDNTIKLWEVATGRELRTLQGHSAEVRSLAFSTDGQTLASGSEDNTIKLWEVATGRELRTLQGHSDPVNSIAIGADGKMLASGSVDRTIRLWELPSGRELRKLQGHSDAVNSVAFSEDGQMLASGSEDHTIKLWEVASGRELRTLRGHSGSVLSIAFSNDGKTVASGSTDTYLKLWNISDGRELASLIAMVRVFNSDGVNDWLVVTPDGLFDGSPAAWNKVLWRFNNNTFDNSPVEAFFNEFYYPGLLADIFAGKRPKADSDIAQKDRRQPRLKLTLPDSSQEKSTARNAIVRVEVRDAPAGAQDLRLFRNGSLVKVWPGDVLKGQKSATLEATIPIVAGENNLTAYAFNHDNIKSGDAELTVNGADSLTRKGTLHILAVGVGQYANPQYNLDYTTDDANAFATQLKVQQEKLGRYESVKITTLLNQDAKKENILAEMKKFAGLVQPEDALVIYFSGHGKANGDHFYLVPHDLGYSGPRDQLLADGLQRILTHSISDVELEEAIRGIDAGQIFMIIDACNSGQALENKDEPRRGPMNTRGLAQLAYEKGIYIMTASQNVEEAFVSAKLKHSYLTYTLVEEGLRTRAADADRNGEVTLREWFDYAVDRVPKLREETLQSKSLEEERSAVKAVRNQKTQTPRAFYRREPESQALVVAKP